MKTVIEMALQAGFTEGELAFMGDNFIRFAKLVRADERARMAEQPAPVQGWKLVPLEPTKEMLQAADDGDDEYTRRNFGPRVQRVMQGPHDHYVAMLAAAPQPEQRKPLTDEQVNLFINGRGDEDDDDYVEPTGDGFGLTDADLVRLVRRVEAAHGIKEKNNG